MPKDLKNKKQKKTCTTGPKSRSKNKNQTNKQTEKETNRTLTHTRTLLFPHL